MDAVLRHFREQTQVYGISRSLRVDNVSILADTLRHAPELAVLRTIVDLDLAPLAAFTPLPVKLNFEPFLALKVLTISNLRLGSLAKVIIPSLERLTADGNHLTILPKHPVANWPQLIKADLSNNRVSSFVEVEKLRELWNLRELNLRHNPVATSNLVRFDQEVLQRLPQLEYLNGMVFGPRSQISDGDSGGDTYRSGGVDMRGESRATFGFKTAEDARRDLPPETRRFAVPDDARGDLFFGEDSRSDLSPIMRRFVAAEDDRSDLSLEMRRFVAGDDARRELSPEMLPFSTAEETSNNLSPKMDQFETSESACSDQSPGTTEDDTSQFQREAYLVQQAQDAHTTQLEHAEEAQEAVLHKYILQMTKFSEPPFLLPVVPLLSALIAQRTSGCEVQLASLENELLVDVKQKLPMRYTEILDLMNQFRIASAQVHSCEEKLDILSIRREKISKEMSSPSRSYGRETGTLDHCMDTPEKVEAPCRGGIAMRQRSHRQTSPRALNLAQLADTRVQTLKRYSEYQKLFAPNPRLSSVDLTSDQASKPSPDAHKSEPIAKPSPDAHKSELIAKISRISTKNAMATEYAYGYKERNGASPRELGPNSSMLSSQRASTTVTSPHKRTSASNQSQVSRSYPTLQQQSHASTLQFGGKDALAVQGALASLRNQGYVVPASIETLKEQGPVALRKTFLFLCHRLTKESTEVKPVRRRDCARFDKYSVHGGISMPAKTVDFSRFKTNR